MGKTNQSEATINALRHQKATNCKKECEAKITVENIFGFIFHLTVVTLLHCSYTVAKFFYKIDTRSSGFKEKQQHFRL